MEIYTGLTTLEKAFVILDYCGLKELMTGIFESGVDLEKLKDMKPEEMKKAGTFFYDIVSKMFRETKLREFYEVITHTKTHKKDIDIEIVLEAIVNFFIGIVKKVPRLLLLEIMKNVKQ